MHSIKFAAGVIIGTIGCYFLAPEKIVIEKQTERVEVPVERIIVKEIKICRN